MYRYQDEFRNQVTISLKAQTKEADDCLVIPVYQGKFLFTMHKTRGIEFPGGKSEHGETTLMAAHRELLEETGARAEELYFVADYLVEGKERTFTKRVFCAEIATLEERTNYLETNGPLLLGGELQKLIRQPEYSFFMRDAGMQFIAEAAVRLLLEKGILE